MTTAKKSGSAATKKAPATKKKAAAGEAKKAAAKKAPAKKAAAAKGSSGRKYSPAAGQFVEQEMREMHEGKLTIGKSKKKVTNPKQAIAIGLAEARRAGKKVPPNPNEAKT